MNTAFKSFEGLSGISLSIKLKIANYSAKNLMTLRGLCSKNNFKESQVLKFIKIYYAGCLKYFMEIKSHKLPSKKRVFASNP